MEEEGQLLVVLGLTDTGDQPVEPIAKNFSCPGKLQKIERTCVDNVYHTNGLTFLLASRIQIKSLHKRNRAPPSLALVSPMNDEVYAPFCVSNESPLADAFPHFRSSLYPQ